MTNRLQQITRCVVELELIENEFKDAPDPLMPLLGQMDWLTELHNLLHGIENRGQKLAKIRNFW